MTIEAQVKLMRPLTAWKALQPAFETLEAEFHTRCEGEPQENSMPGMFQSNARVTVLTLVSAAAATSQSMKDNPQLSQALGVISDKLNQLAKQLSSNQGSGKQVQISSRFLSVEASRLIEKDPLVAVGLTRLKVRLVPHSPKEMAP